MSSAIPEKPAEARRTSPTAAGLEDVVRSLRVLTRSGRDLVVDGGAVLERELSMAVSISERLRDEALSAESLERARAGKLNAALRDDAHRLVDLIADVGGVAAGSAIRFAEELADAPRVSRAVDRLEGADDEPAAAVASG